MKADRIPDEVLERLYGAPAAEFVANRNAAAKELAAAGDAKAADAVRGLRRPSAPAAAINQAVRAEPAQARALLDAAGDLRRAHEAAMAGDADRNALRAATAAERQAVTALARTAAEQASGDRPVSADLERRVRNTLEAVALDQDVRERFEAGRLQQDAQAATLATDLAFTGASPGKARSRSKTAKPRRSRADAEAATKAERTAAREQRKLEQAVRRAQAAVDRRRRDVEAAEDARRRADSTLREARDRLGEAEAELRRTRRA